jgi:probable HAF family extracellular repeat protein
MNFGPAAILALVREGRDTMKRVLAYITFLTVGLIAAPVSAASLYMVTDLGNLGGTYAGFPFSRGEALNDNGQVVGFSFLPNNPNDQAFLYSRGVMIGLGTLPGDASSYANGINNKGQVTGTSASSSVSIPRSCTAMVR